MNMQRLPGILLLLGILGLSAIPAAVGPLRAQEPGGVFAFVGARIIDGTGATPIEDGVIVVQNGRIAAVGPASAVSVPAGATRMDAAGKTIMPGIINTHGHVNDVRGMQSSPEFYTPGHVRRQLLVYARYGVTTVFSLGGDGPAGVQVRDAQTGPGLDRARLFLAGPVVTAADPDAARQAVDAVKAMNADIVKIRVDDNLGASRKMPADAYRAVIERAHRHGLRVAVHIFYLQDAKAVLAAGADFVAHSVRDAPVDAELIAQLKERDRCVCPTLMREVSTFVYESRPSFFDDPFFLREADRSTMEALQAPAYQASNRTTAAVRYKTALEVAGKNLRTLSDAGVRVAFGTDTGPAGRFQGYFEHLELEHMVRAGLTPMQAIVSATGDAARCMEVADRIGTLKPGLEADFLVLSRSPLEDIRNTRSLESVWVRGARISR